MFEELLKPQSKLLLPPIHSHNDFDFPMSAPLRMSQS